MSSNYARYVDVMRDRSGNAVGNADIYVYVGDSTTLAQLYDGAGNLVAQPLSTDEDGLVVNDSTTGNPRDRIGFKARGGRYRVRAVKSGDAFDLPDLMIGTAAGRDVGTDPEQVPTNADLILLSSITARIPTDFATLQSAVDELSRYRTPQGVTITILIESGAQIDRGLIVRDGAYGHFVISSEDSPLVLPASYQGHFVYASNASAPVLNCLVDMSNVPRDNSRAADEAVDPESDPFPRNGYHIDENSSGKVNPGCGFIGIAGRRGISAFRGSKVECEGAIANGGPHIGIVAARGSQISAQGATATGNAGRGVYSARSSTLNFHQGNANNNGLHGIVARRTSIINASLATANNCGGSGIFAEHAATVVALEAEAKGCNIGIEALDASIVDAHEIDISDSAMQAILALGASTVNAEACTGTNCGSGLSGDGGVVTSLGASRVSVGRIRTQAGFLNSDLSGAQYNVLWAGQGSTINASNADLSGANGLAAYATQVSTVNARLADASSTQGFEVARGSFITVSGAVGRENISQTANTVTGDGIIFDENA